MYVSIDEIIDVNRSYYLADVIIGHMHEKKFSELYLSIVSNHTKNFREVQLSNCREIISRRFK
jgi:hypothetical protein